MKNIQNLQNHIIDEFIKLEENCLKEVLRQLLKREPTLEDAKDLQKFQREGEFDRYYLAYKNKKLGTVIRNFSGVGQKVGIEFIPFPIEEFLEPATNGEKVTF